MKPTWILGMLLVFSAGAIQGQHYGQKISLQKPTSIAEILENSQKLEGEKVRIEGRVVDVCTMQGCWIEIQSESGERIRFKVDDGVIVFPRTVKGKEVKAEGTVEVIPMSRERYVGWLRHLAQETGKQFDPQSVGEPPYKIVRLRGSGAEIGSTRPE